MTNDQIITLVIGFVSAGGLFSFFQFLINRKDNKSDKLNDILNKLDCCTKSNARCELLIMMNHYKKDTAEIMRLAERYFVVLEGDFYMTSIFKKWMKTNKIEPPIWFKED